MFCDTCFYPDTHESDNIVCETNVPGTRHPWHIVSVTKVWSQILTRCLENSVTICLDISMEFSNIRIKFIILAVFSFDQSIPQQKLYPVQY